MITIRRYQFRDRTIVRLVPESLSDIEDHQLSTVGVELAAVAPEKLAYEPDYAPLVMLEAMHVAKTNADGAKIRMHSRGERMEGTVLHALPAYYEHAARMFRNLGQPRYATFMLKQARDVEAKHGLAVRSSHLTDIAEEFNALLSGKMLTGYSRALSTDLEPAEAYRIFTARLIEWVKAGNSPYSTLPADLTRMAKKAGRDPVDPELLRKLLPLPAVRDAGQRFWETYRDAIVRLARTDVDTQAALTGFVPAEVAKFRDFWLDLIAAADAPITAAWLRDFQLATKPGLAYPLGRSSRLLELVAANADRLRAAETPVVVSFDREDIDLDLADLLLALDIPVADRVSGDQIDVAGWLRDDRLGQRDLVALAEDKRFRRSIGSSIRSLMPMPEQLTEHLVAFVLAVPGLRIAWRGQLEWCAGWSEQADLPDLEETLWWLRELKSPLLFAIAPEQARRIAEIDVAEKMAEAISEGIYEGIDATPTTTEQARELLAAADIPEHLVKLVNCVNAHTVPEIEAYQAIADAAVTTEIAAPRPFVTFAMMHAALAGATNPAYYYAFSESELPGLVRAIGLLTTAERLPDSLYSDEGFGSLLDDLPRPGVLAYQAASPMSRPGYRVALTELLKAIADAAITDSHWRVVTVTTPNIVPNDNAAVIATPDGFIVLTPEYAEGRQRRGLQYTTGSFTLPTNWKLVTAASCDSGFGPDRIERFIAALEANGPMEIKNADLLAKRTKLDSNAATYLLAGQYVASTELRSALGLTEPALNAAKSLVPKKKHRDLLHLAIPADPADLWRTGPDVDAVAAELNKRVTPPKPPQDPLVAAAKKFLYEPQVVDQVVAMDTSAWRQGANPYALSQTLLFFGYHLPVGAPLRQQLPALLAAARKSAQHPDLLLDLGYLGSAKNRANTLLTLLNQPTTATGEFDANPWLRLRRPDGGVYLQIRPSGYRDQDLPTLTAVTSLFPTHSRHDYRVTVGLLLLRDARLTAACTQQASQGIDPNAYFQDPMVTVPDLVDEAVAKYGLEPDMAVLYLQLLALPDPTDANVARWLGWKPARLKTTRAKLAETDLVVMAKRPKAGRKLFIPGDWADYWFDQPMELAKKWLLRDTDGPMPIYARAPLGTVEWAFRTAWSNHVQEGH